VTDIIIVCTFSNGGLPFTALAIAAKTRYLKKFLTSVQFEFTFTKKLEQRLISTSTTYLTAVGQHSLTDERELCL
jgi:hypothetical protein